MVALEAGGAPLEQRNGVTLAADIEPGSGDSSPTGFTEYRNELYFMASGEDGRELYKVAKNGSVSGSFTVPKGTKPGTYALTLVTTAQNGKVTSVSLTIKVVRVILLARTTRRND